MSKSLNLEATMKRAQYINGKLTTDTGGNGATGGGTTDPGNGGNTSGGDNGGNTGGGDSDE